MAFLNYKMILILILFIGIICIVVELVRVTNKCPEQQIIYRYIPRTFEEEQNEPVLATDVFKSMFLEESPWIASMQDAERRKMEQVNTYFIDQL